MNEISPQEDDSPPQTIQGELRVEYTQGPLPHPRVLGEYDREAPGTAERIMRQWEADSEHRRKMEADGLKHV